jgi:multimeric flavodoxin WrbA
VSKLKVVAINGSPREKWNTATLIKKALEGAESKGAETEQINLYDLNFKGCTSCFSCRTKGSKSYGKCAMQDDLTPVLKNIEESDALILGSPIYLGTVTGEMKSFLERLIFPYLTYTNTPQSLFPKKINTLFIYTMNITEESLEEYGYKIHFATNEQYLKMLFGSTESLFSFDTYQFKDYSKVVADRFDADKKAKRREEVFPLDCQKAFDKGVKIVSEK